jgi:hypothetical protein
MAEVTIKASAKAIEEAGERGDFEECPDGYFTAELARVTVEKGSTSGSQYLKCAWKPVGKGKRDEQLDKTYSWVWDNVQLEGDSTEWKRAQFLLAIGKPTTGKAQGMKIQIEEGKPGTVIGTKVLLKVGSDYYTNAADERVRSAIVKNMFPFEEGEDSDEAAAEGAGEDGTDETPFDESPTDELDEGFDSGEADAEDDSWVPLTKEDLLAGGKDLMMAQLAEYELEKPDGATVKDVVAMILEAQDAYVASLQEDGSDDGTVGEEDPF